MSSFSSRKASLEPDDRDRVARHRNLMCDIALKKQITQMQREGRILEREMREIRKVKETLKQLKKPINQRLQDDQNSTENRYEKAEVKAAANLMGRRGIVRELPQNSEREKQRKPEKGNLVLSGKTVRFDSIKASTTHENLSSARKKTQVEVEKSENQTEAELTEKASSQKPQPGRIIQVAPYSETSSQEPENRTAPSDQASNIQLSDFISRPNTSNLPSVESPIPTQRLCKSSCAVDTDLDMTLTMEETLRIKGKFRQIGHSVIAAALLKGLKQRNTLTSEAIHNLHQTVSLDTPKPTNEDETEEVKETNGDKESSEKSERRSITKRFRKAVRKTVIINRVITAARNSERPRSFSDSENLQKEIPDLLKGESAPSLYERSRKKSLMSTSAAKTRQWRKYGGALRAFQTHKRTKDNGLRRFEQDFDEDFLPPDDENRKSTENSGDDEEAITHRSFAQL